MSRSARISQACFACSVVASLSAASCGVPPLVYLPYLLQQPPDYNDRIIGGDGPLVAIARGFGGYNPFVLRSKESAATGPAALSIARFSDPLAVINVDTLEVDRDPELASALADETACDGRWLVGATNGQTAGSVMDLNSGAEITLGDTFAAYVPADFSYVVSHDRVLAAGARYGSSRVLLAAFDLPAGTQRFITEVEISATGGLRGAVPAFDGEWIAIAAFPPAAAESLEDLGDSGGIELHHVVTGEHRSVAAGTVVLGGPFIAGDRVVWTDSQGYYNPMLQSYSISSGQTQTLAHLDEQVADIAQLVAVGPAGALFLLLRDAFPPPPANPLTILTPGRVTHTYWLYRFDGTPLTIAEELLDTNAAQPTLDPPTAAVTDSKVIYREFTTTNYRIYDIATGQSTAIDPFAG